MSDYIPEEVLVGVLKHLPVKSLVRSRSVCRWWKQLIDSPSLLLDHLALQKPRSLAVDNSQRGPMVRIVDPQTLPLVHAFPYSGSFEVHNLALVGTFNGVVCFHELFDLKRGFYLWNPSVRKSLHVPVDESLQFLRDLDAHSWSYSGFWIDPCTKLFKIVVLRIVSHYPNSQPFGAIYSSSEGGGWKEISPVQLKGIEKYWTREDPSIVMRKRAYWISFDNSMIGYGEWGCIAVVISFDFEQERFDCIEGPAVTFHNNPPLCYWQGSLSIPYLDWGNKCQFYSRQQGSWVNLFSISFTFHINQVFCLVKEMEGNSKILLAQTQNEDLILYDTTRGDCVTLKLYFTGQVAHGFVESLVFP